MKETIDLNASAARALTHIFLSSDRSRNSAESKRGLRIYQGRREQ